jgi:hypothetical protein
MKVKCIDDRGFTDVLKKGSIYNVEKDYQSNFGNGRCFKLEGVKQGMIAKRFTIVEGESTYHPVSINKKKSITTDSSDDPEEERCRNLLKPTILPGHCICQCHRSLCRFHKD